MEKTPTVIIEASEDFAIDQIYDYLDARTELCLYTDEFKAPVLFIHDSHNIYQLEITLENGRFVISKEDTELYADAITINFNHKYGNIDWINSRLNGQWEMEIGLWTGRYGEYTCTGKLTVLE